MAVPQQRLARPRSGLFVALLGPEGEQPHGLSRPAATGLALVLDCQPSPVLAAGRRGQDASRPRSWPFASPRWDRPAGTACRADRRARPGSAETGAGAVSGGEALVAGPACATAGSCSSSKRYMPVLRSILSRGPWATSLPRETVTSSPISTVLALMSKMAQSPVAVWPSLEVISTFCLRLHARQLRLRLARSVVAAARERQVRPGPSSERSSRRCAR